MPCHWKMWLPFVGFGFLACSDEPGVAEVESRASSKDDDSDPDDADDVGDLDAGDADDTDVADPDSKDADAGGVEAEPNASDDDVVDVPAEDDDAAAMDEDEDDITFGGGDVEVRVDPDLTEETDPDASATVDEAPLVSCDVAAGQGEGTLIDDMEDGDLENLIQDGREASWFSYDDDTGGVHSLLMEPVSDSPAGGVRAAYVVGGGFSEWGSGFGVGLRWNDPDGQRCVFDASYYSGLRFWAKGNGTAVRLFATNPSVIPIENGGTCAVEGTCWDNHGFDFVTESEWTLVSVPFSVLLQRWSEPLLDFDPAAIFTVEFSLDAGIDYELWIDDLGFYRDGEDLPPYASP